MYQNSSINVVMDDLIETVLKSSLTNDHRWDTHRAIGKSLRRTGACISWRDSPLMSLTDDSPGFTTAKMPRWVYKVLLKLKWVR